MSAEHLAQELRVLYYDQDGTQLKSPVFPFPFLLPILDSLGLEWTGPRGDGILLTLIALESWCKSIAPDFDMMADSKENEANMGLFEMNAESLKIIFGAVDAQGELQATYSSPVFDDKSYSAYLEAHPSKPDIALLACAPWARQRELITSLLQVRNGVRFLDVGCGHGHLLKLAKSKGAAVTGITPTLQEFEACQAANLDVVLTSLETYVPAEPFDAVSMVEVLMYLSSLVQNKYGLHDIRLQKAAKQAASWLTPGGLLFLQVQAVNSELLSMTPTPEWKRRYDIITSLTDHSCSSIGQVLAAFTTEGFEVVSCEESREDAVRFMTGMVHRMKNNYDDLMRVQYDPFIWKEFINSASILLEHVECFSLYRLVLRKKNHSTHLDA